MLAYLFVIGLFWLEIHYVMNFGLLFVVNRPYLLIDSFLFFSFSVSERLSVPFVDRL